MKEQIKKGLEKVVEVGREITNHIKKNGKRALIIFSLPFLINSSVNSGVLNTYCRSPLTSPYNKIRHLTGATEGYDDNNGKDARFLEFPFNPAIDFYSKINFDPYRLSTDARLPESMSTFNIEISGRGLTAPENAVLEPKFSYYLGDNFWWKNIIGELSQRVDDGNGGYKYALIGDYDILHFPKNRLSGGQFH